MCIYRRSATLKSEISEIPTSYNLFLPFIEVCGPTTSYSIIDVIVVDIYNLFVRGSEIA